MEQKIIFPKIQIIGTTKYTTMHTNVRVLRKDKFYLMAITSQYPDAISPEEVDDRTENFIKLCYNLSYSCLPSEDMLEENQNAFKETILIVK